MAGHCGAKTTLLETDGLHNQSEKPKEETISETKLKDDKFDPGLDKFNPGVDRFELGVNYFIPGIYDSHRDGGINPGFTQADKKIKKYRVAYKDTSGEVIYKYHLNGVIYEDTSCGVVYEDTSGDRVVYEDISGTRKPGKMICSWTETRSKVEKLKPYSRLIRRAHLYLESLG